MVYTNLNASQERLLSYRAVGFKWVGFTHTHTSQNAKDQQLYYLNFAVVKTLQPDSPHSIKNKNASLNIPGYTG